MEYLKPLNTLQEMVKRDQKIIYALCILLGVSLIGVPLLFKNGPYLVKDQESFSSVVKASPWKLTVTRLDEFCKFYLNTRFEWAPDNFKNKEDRLQQITSKVVYQKLKQSLTSFQSIADNEKARSYYILENDSFSNVDHKIEANVIRVLKIKNIAVATPYTVRLSFQESIVTEANPYGLILNGIEEVAPQSDSQGGGASE
jgi:hypothetical protein